VNITVFIQANELILYVLIAIKLKYASAMQSAFKIFQAIQLSIA
jgi:hypothetical protein